MNGAKSKAWALALLLGVLLLGGVAGAAVDRMLVRKTAAADTRDRRDGDRDRRSSYLDWLSTELELTQEQRGQVEVIIDRYREQVSALWRETRPQYDTLRSSVRAEIRQLLSEDQQTKYEALLENQTERHRRRRKSE